MISWYLFYRKQSYLTLLSCNTTDFDPQDPPTFSMLHRKKLAKDLLLRFDWIGVILYSGGLAILIFGLNWGGVLYVTQLRDNPYCTCLLTRGKATHGTRRESLQLPSLVASHFSAFSRPTKSSSPNAARRHICPFIYSRISVSNPPLGILGLLLVCTTASRSSSPKSSPPYTEAGAKSVITMSVHSQGSLQWPTVSPPPPPPFNPRAPLGRPSHRRHTLTQQTVFAQMCHGFIVWFTGPKWAMIGSAAIAVVLLTCCAIDIDNRPLTEGLLITGAYAMGVVESVAITTSTFPLRSQEEIGQGGGLSGSIRNFVSAISVAVYTATLNNRLDVTIPNNVYPVALAKGLPKGSLPALAAALGGKGTYGDVKGLNSAIKAAVQEPYREAFVNAARTVFLVSLAFSGSALILSFFTTNNDKSTEHYVAGSVGQKKKKDDLEDTNQT